MAWSVCGATGGPGGCDPKLARALPKHASPRAGGRTFVGWGQLGRISEFDGQGGLLFDAQLPPGFDTPIAIPTGAVRVRVVALDARGRTLSSSAVTPTS